MQVICTDGTTFRCEGYQLTEYGVKLLGEDRDGDDDRYDDDPKAVGYLPHDRLWYILPEGVQPNPPGATAPAGDPAGQPPVDVTQGQPHPGQAAPPASASPGPRR